MSKFVINNQHVSLDDVSALIKSGHHIELGGNAKKAIVNCRSYLDKKVEETQVPIYGINTGFGSLYDAEISKQDLAQLQTNLVRSHACGMGDEVPQEIVRLMILLKIIGLSQGHSGVQLNTVERLVDLYNKGVMPVIYQLGSLGASGDLAPLAHLALVLIGEGEADYNGKRYRGEELHQKLEWKPIQLQSKEGLALLNGTQFMSAYATHCLIKVTHLFQWNLNSAATSLDAFDGRIEAFDEDVHKVRPHNGQLVVSKAIRELLSGSELIKRKKAHVQDPYCLRCIPQVHGASSDTISYAKQVVETEINSVTDNPTIFEEADKIISAGNFHGQPLALILDFLAIAIAELGSITERRVYKLVSGQRGLPPFLVSSPGLNSGFMIVQYTAASAVSQNKQLATPASVDSIDSSNGQEDHVSMGANAATKLHRVVLNYERLVAIEWMTACQALDFRNEKSSPKIEELKSMYRSKVSFIEKDVTFYPLIEKSIQFIREN